MSKFKPEFYDGEISGVKLIQASVFEEDRGNAYTLYDRLGYTIALDGLQFNEEKITVTNPGWARGLHADNKNWKLMTCVGGEFLLILLDGRTFSDTYGKKEMYQLKYNSGTQILVPPGVYNGHLNTGLSPCVLHYAWSHGYEGQQTQKTVGFLDKGLNWNESDIKNLGNYLLSDRDLNHTTPFSESGFK